MPRDGRLALFLPRLPAAGHRPLLVGVAVMTPLPPAIAAALTAAAELLERVTFDSDGVMVGFMRQGGNGGIISNDTLRAADALRLALDRIEQEHPHE